MEFDKRWTIAIVTVLTMILIYCFLTMALKKEKKEKGKSRIGRSYSSYSNKSYSGDNKDRSYNSNYDFISAEVKQIKREMFSDLGNITINGYNEYMQKALKKDKNSEENEPKITNPQYLKMIELSKQPLPELHFANAFYRKGEYEEAVLKLNEALEKLDPMEIKNRLQIYSMLAECYLKLKDDDNYINSMIKHIRMQKKYNKLMKETFSDYPDHELFMSTSDASANLLRIKSSVARLPDSPQVREMIKRAELDLQIARKVSQ